MAQLKGKKLEERLQNFLIWQETIQERLKVLTINSNLDFSPDSLNLIEQKILENYMAVSYTHLTLPTTPYV